MSEKQSVEEIEDNILDILKELNVKANEEVLVYEIRCHWPNLENSGIFRGVTSLERKGKLKVLDKERFLVLEN